MEVTINDITRFLSKKRLNMSELQDFIYILDSVNAGKTKDEVITEFLEKMKIYYSIRFMGEFEKEMYQEHYNRLYDLSVECVEDARQYKLLMESINK
jgi:hypothetical protein